MNLITKRFQESIDRASTTYVMPDSVRKIRNNLLTETDWTQLPDNGLSDAKRAEWTAYRQALRDLPNTGDLDNVVWPQKPN